MFTVLTIDYFSKYLLYTYCMPGTGASKTKSLFSSVWRGHTINNKQIMDCFRYDDKVRSLRDIGVETWMVSKNTWTWFGHIMLWVRGWIWRNATVTSGLVWVRGSGRQRLWNQMSDKKLQTDQIHSCVGLGRGSSAEGVWEAADWGGRENPGDMFIRRCKYQELPRVD